MRRIERKKTKRMAKRKGEEGEEDGEKEDAGGGGEWRKRRVGRVRR